MFDRTLFKAQMVIAGVSMDDLARAIGVNESTMYRKLLDDGRFTRNEIVTLTKVLKIDSLSLVNRIFFGIEHTETKEDDTL